jgi:hypothetical protein
MNSNVFSMNNRLPLALFKLPLNVSLNPAFVSSEKPFFKLNFFGFWKLNMFDKPVKAFKLVFMTFVAHYEFWVTVSFYHMVNSYKVFILLG